MSFSFHPNVKDTHFDAIYVNGYREYLKDDITMVARAIKKCVTSPIVWRNGQRRKSNFSHVDWIALDFDSGTTIKEALDRFSKYTHVLGTTKSHMIRKKGEAKALPRFRLWIKLKERCESLDNYSYTVKKLAVLSGGDIQAIDGARKFKPSKDIISKGDGELLEIEVKPPEAPVNNDQFTGSRERYIPMFVKNLLAHGTTHGRNFACFKIGQYLSKNHFGVDEVVSMIMQSNLPAASATESEVRSAVRNGFSRSL